MKKYTIIIITSLLFCNSSAQQNNLQFKKFYDYGIEKRVKYTDSFICGYVQNDTVKYYSHQSDIYTKYDIASISKTFTALVVIKLHFEKKLHVDAQVSNYIKYYDSNVTIRHLLTHTARRPYGELASYSNLNYVSLKDIIETVTRDSYEYNVYKYILHPLGMYETDAQYGNGAGSIFSNLHDLSIYCTMLLNNGKPILNDKEYEMFVHGSLENKTLYWYWTTGGYESIDGKSLYKSGRWYYSVTGIEIFPEQKQALIYLASKKNCLTPYVAQWRNYLWKYLRRKI